MTQVRVYLPLSREQVRTLAADRELVTPAAGYTVTHAVAASDPTGGEEEWEFAALQDAARACRAQGDPVIVAAVDLDPEGVDATSPSGSSVTVIGPLPVQRIASFQVGDEVVDGTTAPAGPEPDRDIELSWYDTTELAVLVDLLDAR